MTTISVFYDEKDSTRKAEIVQFNNKLWVEFYANDVIIDSLDIENMQLQYAEDIAENYINNNYNLSNTAWGLNVIRKDHIQ